MIRLCLDQHSLYKLIFPPYSLQNYIIIGGSRVAGKCPKLEIVLSADSGVKTCVIIGKQGVDRTQNSLFARQNPLYSDDVLDDVFL